MDRDNDVCDLVVWDAHGDLTSQVRRQLKQAVRRSAAKIEEVGGAWRGRRVVVARARRVTAAQAPAIRDVLAGLIAVHKPRRLAIVGTAAAGDSGLAPGRVAALADHPDLRTAWGAAATRASDELGAAAVLLGVVTSRATTAPGAARPTLARVAGRWFGALQRGSTPPATRSVDAGAAVAESLAGLLEG